MRSERGGGFAALVHRPAGLKGDAPARWGILRWRSSGRLRPSFERLRRRPPFKIGDLFPLDLARDRRGRFYVPGEFGLMARVRPDGRRDVSWAPGGIPRHIRTGLSLSALDVVILRRGRVVAVGLAADRGELREDYGLTTMWVAAFR